MGAGTAAGYAVARQQGRAALRAGRGGQQDMTAGAAPAAEADISAGIAAQHGGRAGTGAGQIPVSQSRSAPQASQVCRIAISIPHNTHAVQSRDDRFCLFCLPVCVI